jgi:hypothetical protein
MTKTQKTLLTAGIITGIILWFSRKRSKSNSAKAAIDDLLDGAGNIINEPAEKLLFFGAQSDFETETFFLITPKGNFTIKEPNTALPNYNQLYNGTDFQFGWQAPYPGRIVVTLMPMEQNPIVENIIIDLDSETVQFEYVQL